MGWDLNAASLHDQIWVAAITLVGHHGPQHLQREARLDHQQHRASSSRSSAWSIFAIVMLIVHRHQSISVVTNSGGLHVGFGAFFAAMFMSLFVIYGFDTASTLAEETNDPRRKAPQAVLASVGGAFVIGGIFLLATLMAIPNLRDGHQGRAGGRRRSSTPTSRSSGRPSICSSCRRPSSSVACASWRRPCGSASAWPATTGSPSPRALAKVHPRLHTPIWACIAVAIVAAIPLFKYAGAGYVAIAATGMIYLSYFLGNLAVMKARLRRLAEGRAAPFRLGRVGPDRQRARPRLRRRHARELRLAPGGEQPDAEPDAGLAEPRGVVPQQDPDPLHGAGLHLDHRGRSTTACSRSRKDIQVHVPAESGPVEIPPESLPPEESRLGRVGSSLEKTGSPQCSGRSKLQTTMRVRSPRNRSLANSTGLPAPSKATRSTSSKGAPRLTPRSWAACAVGPDRLERLDRPARPGVEANGQELIERAFERLLEHAGEALGRKARATRGRRACRWQGASRATSNTGAPSSSPRARATAGEADTSSACEQTGARFETEAAGLLGKTGETRQVALDRRLGDERATPAADRRGG